MFELCNIAVGTRLGGVFFQFKNISSRKSVCKKKLYVQICPKKDDQINFLCYNGFMLTVSLGSGEASWK